ncbi:TadE/TadG family type IV pilus assembly protein [Novosphingobium sp.]|uniref:TadE/TadG family type IV pilus assembly protein n=1 Tax=Novosphingobium sp. TaxID=1874826 RepID=UPI00263A11BA|nr:TadE/TadG family type IV pilus assembly protein [Novosphingobium sp.]
MSHRHVTKAATWGQRWLSLGRMLARDNLASVTIEFAVVGPMTIAAIVAILHTALVFMAQQGLQSAAESAGRLIMTGQAQKYSGSNYTGMTADDFKKAICGQLTGFPTLLPPFLTCDKLYVDVSIANSHANAVTSAPTFTYNSGGSVTNTFGYSPGTAGPGVMAAGGTTQVVVVRLMYLWPTATAPMGFNLVNQQGSNRLLTASTVLVTEAYQ